MKCLHWLHHMLPQWLRQLGLTWCYDSLLAFSPRGLRANRPVTVCGRTDLHDGSDELLEKLMGSNVRKEQPGNWKEGDLHHEEAKGARGKSHKKPWPMVFLTGGVVQLPIGLPC